MLNMTQGPAAPRAPVTAEEAQLDRRIELAAKKAALRSLEAQEGGPSTDTPAPPGMEARVVIEKDGKTIVLENPTAEQLAAVGIGSTAPSLVGWQKVAVTGSAMFAIVAVLYMVLNSARRFSGTAARGPTQEMANRIERIENAIESVAVEVERISEGQRFTSRILSEGAAAPVSVGEQRDRLRQNGEG